MSRLFQIMFICLVTCKVGSTLNLQRLNQGLFMFTFPSFSTALHAPVVERVDYLPSDYFIQRINRYPEDKMYFSGPGSSKSG